jgi:hypothetical protein
MVGGVLIPFEQSGEAEYALAELEPPSEWLLYAEEMGRKLVENPARLGWGCQATVCCGY